MWLLVMCYIAFCLLFIASFVSNVSTYDLQVWLWRMSTSLSMMAVFIPIVRGQAAHRLYLKCLENEDSMQDLHRELYLVGEQEEEENEVEAASQHPLRSEAWSASLPDAPPDLPERHTS